MSTTITITNLESEDAESLAALSNYFLTLSKQAARTKTFDGQKELFKTEDTEREVNSAASAFVPLFTSDEIKESHEIDVDSAGQVWDEKIHTRSKSKTLDGRWKSKRNTTREEENDEPIKPPTFSNTSVGKPFVIPTPPIAPGNVPASNFSSLMLKITKAVITDKLLSREQVIDVLKKYGIEEMPLLSTRPDLIPRITQDVEKLIELARG